MTDSDKQSLKDRIVHYVKRYNQDIGVPIKQSIVTGKYSHEAKQFGGTVKIVGELLLEGRLKDKVSATGSTQLFTDEYAETIAHQRVTETLAKNPSYKALIEQKIAEGCNWRDTLSALFLQVQTDTETKENKFKAQTDEEYWAMFKAKPRS